MKTVPLGQLHKFFNCQTNQEILNSSDYRRILSDTVLVLDGKVVRLNHQGNGRFTYDGSDQYGFWRTFKLSKEKVERLHIHLRDYTFITKYKGDGDIPKIPIVDETTIIKKFRKKWYHTSLTEEDKNITAMLMVGVAVISYISFKLIIKK